MAQYQYKVHLSNRSGLLEIRSHASGLHINFAKVSPIACLEKLTLEAVEVMECWPSSPLSTSPWLCRLPSDTFRPLVDRTADRLPTWKASMMAKVGRLTLVKSVLATIPLHQIMVLGLNKVLKEVEKIL